MKTLLLKTIFAILAAIGFSQNLCAQERVEKTMETFNVKDGVSIDVDGAYTTFIIETWNKDQVLVEAFIETLPTGQASDKDLTEEEKQQLVDNWDLNILGNSEEIRISSNGGISGFLNSFVFNGNDKNNFISPPRIGVSSSMPVNLSQFQMSIAPPPSLPPGFYKNMSQLAFDYKAYWENGEDYLKKYEKQIEEKFGKDFREKMKNYAQEITEQMKQRKALIEERRKEVKNRIEKMNNKFVNVTVDIDAEATDEKSAKTLEEWAAENPNANYSKKVTIGPNGEKTISWSFSSSRSWSSENSGKKTVIVHVPKDAKLNIQIRHGKVELDESTNLQARLSHTPFTAEKLDGEKTQIRVSYAPVKITNWVNGSLSLSYIGDCNIGNVRNIKLVSNMSDLKIGNIEEFGMIRGSFGELSIEKVGKDFKTLNIDLQNSQLNLQLPDTAFDFDFDGEHSKIDLPSSLKVESRKNYGQTFISGYNRSENNSGRISIEADFSEVKIRD